MDRRLLQRECMVTREEALDLAINNESDQYWIDVFHDLECDKPPRGVKINETEIYSLIKGKEFSISFDDPDLASQIKEIFSRLFGYHSPEERKTILDSDVHRQKIVKWKDTGNKKSVKDFLILDFVSRKGTEHGLSLTTKQELLFTISSALVFKTISPDDFTIVNGKIENIDDLVISNGSYKLMRSIPPTKKTYKNTKRMVSDAQIILDD